MLLSDYIESHTTSASNAAAAVERWAHLHTAQPQMLCGQYEGMLLTTLCRATGGRCAVEIGAYVGYSTIFIAQGLGDNGCLHTFEVNDENEQAIDSHLRQAGVRERVSLHIGDALSLIPSVFRNEERAVDFAFIDADKRHMRDFYELMMPLMRVGGIIVVDNVLWSGKVLDLDKNRDIDTAVIHAFNEFVQNDPRVENIMLDVRDGLLICSVL